MSIKRLNYFNHQFLEEQDFREEQQYQIEMRRRHTLIGAMMIHQGDPESLIEEEIRGSAA